MNFTLRSASLFCGLALLALTMTRVAANDATPSALSTDPKDWEDIMPTADLKGWMDVPIPATAKLKRAQWHMDQSQLVCDGDGGHDMFLLDRKLTNGIFHVEFCFTKINGAKPYNSGVFIRTSKDGVIWHQAQVGALNGGYWFGNTPVPGGAAKRFEIKSPCHVTEAGQWNTFELTAQGSKLALWVNGYPSVPMTDCGVPDGYLALEGEGYHITFRNLKLKTLP